MKDKPNFLRLVAEQWQAERQNYITIFLFLLVHVS